MGPALQIPVIEAPFLAWEEMLQPQRNPVSRVRMRGEREAGEAFLGSQGDLTSFPLSQVSIRPWGNGRKRVHLTRHPGLEVVTSWWEEGAGGPCRPL